MSFPIVTDRPSRGIDLLARLPLLRRLSLQRWFPLAGALFLLVLGAVLTPEQQAELEKKKAAEQQAAAAMS